MPFVSRFPLIPDALWIRKRYAAKVHIAMPTTLVAEREGATQQYLSLCGTTIATDDAVTGYPDREIRLCGRCRETARKVEADIKRAKGQALLRDVSNTDTSSLSPDELIATLIEWQRIAREVNW